MVSNAVLESIIETLEILRDSKRFNLQTDVLCVAKELKLYRAIGTVEECKQAMEAKKKKHLIVKKEYNKGYMHNAYFCSKCDTFICFEGEYRSTNINRCYKFCKNCGQYLDWTKGD